MIRAVFRFGFRVLRLGTKLALVAGAAFAVFKLFESRQTPEPLGPASPPPAPPPPRRDRASVATTSPPQAATKAAPSRDDGDLPTATSTAPAWVEPEHGACPASHPIKAKLSSRIYHLPGMVAYERTVPDRCYLDEDTAGADGLRKSKR